MGKFALIAMMVGIRLTYLTKILNVIFVFKLTPPVVTIRLDQAFTAVNESIGNVTDALYIEASTASDQPLSVKVQFHSVENSTVGEFSIEQFFLATHKCGMGF